MQNAEVFYNSEIVIRYSLLKGLSIVFSGAGTLG